jgi:hypothetical protein
VSTIKEVFVAAVILKPEVLGDRPASGGMTPLEAAKALAALDPIVSIWTNTGGESECFACQAYDHKTDCPVPHVPAIVAALEAAERVKQAVDVENHRFALPVIEVVNRLASLATLVKGEQPA